MATVYGYFRSDDEARKAAERCEEIGITSTVVTQDDQPSYMDTSVVPAHRRREKLVMRISLITAVVIGLLGAFVWTVIPALWSKVVLAGPLMMALYAITIGLGFGTFFSRSGRYADEVPADISTHTRSQRVLVLRPPSLDRSEEIERVLESEGAVEVIHRAA